MIYHIFKNVRVYANFVYFILAIVCCILILYIMLHFSFILLSHVVIFNRCRNWCPDKNCLPRVKLFAAELKIQTSKYLSEPLGYFNDKVIYDFCVSQYLCLHFNFLRSGTRVFMSCTFQLLGIFISLFCLKMAEKQ